MNRIRLVVFDMDGTIVNSTEKLARLGVNMLTLHTDFNEIEALQHYNSTIGIPFMDQILLTKGMKASKAKIIAKEYQNEHLEMARSYFVMDPEAAKFISWLKRLCQTALITSSSKEIMEECLHGYEDQLFHTTDSYDVETAHSKFWQLKKFIDKGIRGENILYCGDTPHDRSLATELAINFRETEVNNFKDKGMYEEFTEYIK